ncbi:gephyrin [Fistulifera solaris]|uniref:molybdopterin adenylyltransferase n=1 Tax=Fistulifera solaris TaxID=1519565 RepID=A0A1Z5KGA7_FISSO|nr:gephyrin [Fistulifera solaris]|eukprot:GAX25236.1 gephyrin [Fistulifera solaris]
MTALELNKPVHPMVSVPEAIRIVLHETARILLSNSRPTECVKIDAQSVRNIVNRTLAADVIQREPGYPPYRASIMDGFAVSSTSPQTKYQVVGKILTGDSHLATITTSDDPPAHYVTTGAIVPDQYDCVVPIEECQLVSDGAFVIVQKESLVKDKWIRPPGCDIPGGSIVLKAGHKIDAVSLGLLLQSGVQEVELVCPLVVGVLSTGNELDVNDTSTTDHWAERQLGKIPDVNRPMLLSLLGDTWGACCRVVDLGIAVDSDRHQLARVLETAFLDCHVIVTTGGISVGETDIVEDVLVNDLKGRLHFGRLHMKPGKPTTFMTLPVENERDRIVFCMPGNPVSAGVCTHLLIRPCLELLFHGPASSPDNNGDSLDEQIRRTVENAWIHSEFEAQLTHDVALDVERPEYARVVVRRRASGICQVSTTGVQRSSRLMSMRDAVGLIVLPQGSKTRPKALAGETYLVLQTDHCNSSLAPITVQSSRHLSKPSKSFSVAVVVLSSIEAQAESAGAERMSELADRVAYALSGSKSGSVTTIKCEQYEGPIDESFKCYLEDKGRQADFVVVLSSTSKGSFRRHSAAAAYIRSILTKPADSMALQVRRGSAAKNNGSAIFETVIGYFPVNEKGFLVVLLAEMGLEGGLGNVRGLLKHAIKIARNKE